jgi:hypothetical protein
MNDDEMNDEELEEYHRQLREIMQDLERYCRLMEEMPIPEVPTPIPKSTAPKMSNPPTDEERMAYRKWMKSDDPEATRLREEAKERFQKYRARHRQNLKPS